MRKIAIKKWLTYERDRGWVWVVYGDFLEAEEWRGFPEVPCPLCGRSVLMKEIAMDHIENRHDFPAEINNPHNWQPLCKLCNDRKFDLDHGEDKKRRNLDHRGHRLALHMELRIMSDWNEGLGRYTPDENCGVWEKGKVGLVVKTKTRGDQ